MAPNEQLLERAFENHLQFLARHRGRLTRDADGVRLEGASPELSSWTPRHDRAAIPPDCNVVRLAPWSGAVWGERLKRARFAPAEMLVYMALGDLRSGLAPSEAVEAAQAGTPEQAVQFAAVQSAGFATGDPKVDRWWESFFREMALANHCDPDQSFYLGRVGGIAVGSTLMLRTSGIAGIYAVATRPEHRNRGVSATLLEHARVKALTFGCEALILQAMAGSYAESYYAHLGFGRLRSLAMWRR